MAEKEVKNAPVGNLCGVDEDEDDDFEIVIAPTKGGEAETMPLSQALEMTRSLGWRETGFLDSDATEMMGWSKTMSWEREACVRWCLWNKVGGGTNKVKEVRRQLALQMVRGCPHHCRRSAWMAVCGADVGGNGGAGVAELSSMMASGADDKARVIRRAPEFGGPKGGVEADHPLTSQGWLAHGRIMAATAMYRPDLVECCPVLQDLTAGLLCYCGELDAMRCIEALLKEQRTPWGGDLDANLQSECSGCCSFPGTEVACVNNGQATAASGFSLNVQCILEGTSALREVESAVDIRISTANPRLYCFMGEVLSLPPSLVSSRWISRLFCGHVAYPSFLRIIDMLLGGVVRGLAGLVRLSVVILLQNAQAIIDCQSSHQVEVLLSSYLKDIGSMDRALRIAGGRDGPQTGGGAISVSEVVSLAKKSSPGRGGGGGGGGGVYYLPVVEPVSSLLSDEDFELIWSWLPPRLRVRDCGLVYRSASHGLSLKTLYSMCRTGNGGFIKGGGCLIIIKSVEGGGLAGAFLTELPRVDSKILGGGECFTFSLRDRGESSETAYFWQQGQPKVFLSCEESFIGIGGGDTGYAIRLNQ